MLFSAPFLSIDFARRTQYAHVSLAVSQPLFICCFLAKRFLAARFFPVRKRVVRFTIP
jgi:hypothetical protein